MGRVLPRRTSSKYATNSNSGLVVQLKTAKTYKNLPMAHRSFSKAAQVENNLGTDFYVRLNEPGILPMTASQIVAQNITLGWVISRLIHKNTILANT